MQEWKFQFTIFDRVPLKMAVFPVKPVSLAFKKITHCWVAWGFVFTLLLMVIVQDSAGNSQKLKVESVKDYQILNKILEFKSKYYLLLNMWSLSNHLISSRWLYPFKNGHNITYPMNLSVLKSYQNYIM